MSVDRRVLVAPVEQERVAVVSIAIPAGGEIEIDPAWRFEGWMTGVDVGRWKGGHEKRRITTEKPPTQHVTEEAWDDRG